MIRFGPGGNPTNFYDDGNKSSLQMPVWLKNKGLNAYEYQCNKGVKISKEKAKELGELAKKNDIFLSIHAPYYISLSSVEKEKREKSVDYIISTLKIAKEMGANRIVVHSGSVNKMNRTEAMGLAIQTLQKSINVADELGLGDISICPETMGKVNQLGNRHEVIELCQIDKRLIPTIDFGHIHVRDLGCLNTEKDFEELLDLFISELGMDRMKNFHSHFSKIEFTAGGEKRHWTLADSQFGPDFNILARVLKNRDLEPVVICESKDIMADDALLMKRIYEEI